MSSHQEKPGAPRQDVSLHRRRLVKGAAAAVPAILTLRSGAARALGSEGLVTSSSEGNAYMVDVDGDLKADGYICVGADDVTHLYDGKYDGDPNSACAAPTKQECIDEFAGKGYDTGVLVSSESLNSLGITADSVDTLCNS